MKTHVLVKMAGLCLALMMFSMASHAQGGEAGKRCQLLACESGHHEHHGDLAAQKGLCRHQNGHVALGAGIVDVGHGC